MKLPRTIGEEWPSSIRKRQRVDAQITVQRNFDRIVRKLRTFSPGNPHADVDVLRISLALHVKASGPNGLVIATEGA